MSKEIKKTDSKQDKGKKGEEWAVNFLTDKGHELLERNYRHSRGEIDIITEYKNQLIFTEVKFRSTPYFGVPEVAVTKQKQANLAKVAQAYMDKVAWQGEIRFDVVAIVLSKGEPSIYHIEDAFWPKG